MRQYDVIKATPTGQLVHIAFFDVSVHEDRPCCSQQVGKDGIHFYYMHHRLLTSLGQ